MKKQKRSVVEFFLKCFDIYGAHILFYAINKKSFIGSMKGFE